VCRLSLPVCPSVLAFLTSVQSVHGCCKGLWTILNLHPLPPSLCCMVTLFALHFPGEMGTRYVCGLERRGEREGRHFPYRNILQKGRCPTPTHNHAALYFLNNPPGGTNSQTLLLLLMLFLPTLSVTFSNNQSPVRTPVAIEACRHPAAVFVKGWFLFPSHSCDTYCVPSSGQHASVCLVKPSSGRLCTKIVRIKICLLFMCYRERIK